MQKVTKSIAICFLLAVIFVIGCGEDSTLPTKVKKDGGESIGLAVSHTEALNGEDFSVAIAQELAEQGVKLSETSTIWARKADEEWLVTDTENELAYVITNAGGDKLEVGKTGYIDYQGEADQVIKLWETFRDYYNTGELTKTVSLLTGKESDQLYINIAENEMIEASAIGVSETLKKLQKGHHTTANDKFVGTPMSEVYIKKRGSQLVASATGPNAFRKAGETWIYCVKVLNKWKVNKLESIEQRNMGVHTNILIHEKEAEDGIGYFNDKKSRVR